MATATKEDRFGNKSSSDNGKSGSNVATYFSESWRELKKVHFPTRQEALQVTIAVLGLIAVFGFFLGFTDFVVGRLMQWALTS